MRIAVIGSGVSGLTAAWLLSRRHQVDVFERDPRPGGHAHTHEFDYDGRRWVADSGFLVFNERTYPNFIRLLARLGITPQPSDMSFSVRCRRCRLEWGSRDLRAWFAQPSRLFDVGHLRMLRDIVRFFRHGRAFLDASDTGDVSLAAFLSGGGYGDTFERHFLLPMTGAIWSASFEDIRQFPARTLLRFLDNHGLLAVSSQPPWFTIPGGSRTYVEALVAGISGEVRTSAGVVGLQRDEDGVTVTLCGGVVRRFDAAIVATHADQALGLLQDPSDAERDALGRFRYSINHAVLHADTAALPARRAAWASWNCDIGDCRDERAPISLSYHVNRLQAVGSLDRGPQFSVSLNRETSATSAIAEMFYAHPILDRAAVGAQPAVRALNGTRRTYYCGAHLGFGFHEDGVVSALAVTRQFGIGLENDR